MKTINVKETMGSDLVSRLTARDFLAFVKNTGENQVVLDFSGVEFISRSFADEFYNAFHLNSDRGFEFTMVNVPENVDAMVKAVAATQDGSGKTVEKDTSVHRPKNIEDLEACFMSMSI